jgi:hypothetical protein
MMRDRNDGLCRFDGDYRWLSNFFQPSPQEPSSTVCISSSNGQDTVDMDFHSSLRRLVSMPIMPVWLD